MSEVIVGVDVGGTFTDLMIVRRDPPAALLWKCPSSNAEPDRAIVRGLAEALAQFGLSPSDVTRFAHGTTVGTNALIERRCGTVAVATTEGFRDLLEIGRQTRPRIYDLHLDNPPPLVPRELRFEVAERMRADGTVHRALDEASVTRTAKTIAASDVDCVVVCFLHSHAHPEHERRAAELIRAAVDPEIDVICSSTVHPEFREYERFSTAVLNGALLTVMREYLTRLGAGIAGLGVKAETLVSQSAGGLFALSDAARLPIRTALSGPAAGVLGAAFRARAAAIPDIITMDVGGTSTDVSLVSGGEPARNAGRTLAGFPLRLPTIDVNAVGAGGGSIAWIDRDGLLKVGPRSAGAEPGPICYARGGKDITVTDANVVLGRLRGDALLGGRMKIDSDLSRRAIEKLATELELSPLETALGIVRVTSANMVRAIRTISVERGHRPGDFALFAFGGAGPLHASDVARELEMDLIVVPPRPGLLCAEGLLFSDLTADFVATLTLPLADASLDTLTSARSDLSARAATWFAAGKVAADRREMRWSYDLRYVGQNFELAVAQTGAALDGAAFGDLASRFHRLHEQNYGFAFEREPIEIVNVRLTAIGRLDPPTLEEAEDKAPATPVGTRDTVFREPKPIPTPIYRREDLARGQRIAGPAIVEQLDTTTIVFPDETLAVDRHGNLLITRRNGGGK